MTNKKEHLKKLSIINNFKVKVKNKIDIDGEKTILTIKFNKKLRDCLKNAMVLDSEKINQEYYTGFETFNYKRFKAKTVYLNSLSYGDVKYFLYNEDLIEKGVLKISFESFEKQDNFLSDLTTNLNLLIKAILNNNINQELNFSLNIFEK